MKKIICYKCNAKRGRRQCIRYNNRYICGDCCSSMQLNADCPKDCIHLGKIMPRDLNKKTSELINTGIQIRDRKPEEAIKLFDRALKLDKNIYQCLIEKSAAHEKLGQYDDAVDCLKQASALKEDSSIYRTMIGIYRKTGKINECLNVLMNYRDKLDGWEADYLTGECYFLSGEFEKAVQYMDSVLKNAESDMAHLDRARIILAKIYLAYRDIDKVIENAESVSRDFEQEKNTLIESAYFVTGRMYELLKLIDSMEKVGYGEKFMLLQCTLVLRKNSQGGIIDLIDDILKNGYYSSSPYEETRLVGLKVRLLFKELKIKEAYELFDRYEDRLVKAAKDIYDCYEACSLIAFFLYNLDKNKSISLYRTVTSMDIDSFIIDELYNAFTTMNITPYVIAKSIEKSIELMKSGKSQSFNRTSIVADILFEYGEFSQAFDLYKRITDSERPDTVIMYKMAVCLMKQNKFEDALEIFINILGVTKYIPGVYPGIIKCCLETNREWTDFFQSLELEKLSFSEIYELAGNMMSKEHYDKAGYLYSYMMEKYKTMDVYSRKMIYHNMASVYRKLKDYSKAMEIIGEIPEKYYGECLAIDMGCLYFDVGDFDRAGEIFESVASCSDSPVVYFNLGILNIKLKNYHGALQYFAESIDKTISEIRRKKAFNAREYGSMLIKLYRNTSLCQIKLGRIEEALLSIEKALNIEKSQREMDIVTMVQRILLNRDKGWEENGDDIEVMMDSCITVREGFTEDIRRLLDGILNRTYSLSGKNRIKINDGLSDDIAAFIRNERRVYSKYKDSIERSEGTFQRYVDNMILSFERRTLPDYIKEAATAADGKTGSIDILKYTNVLLELGDRMFKNFEYTKSEEYIYASLIPYYKIIKMCAVETVYPYYKKNIDFLPVPGGPEDFKNIGVYSYMAGGETCYRMDFSFNISCSEYLFEINCHPGLRSEYINCKKHYMPWNKLLWIISGMKKKWNVIDDAKSVGLMLLFYCGYKNYMGIQGDFDSMDEIIKLSGDLIQMNNERDYYIRNMLKGSYEFDYLNCVKNVRILAQRCMDGLMKIKRLE